MKKRKPANPSALVKSISKEFGHLFLDNSGLVDIRTEFGAKKVGVLVQKLGVAPTSHIMTNPMLVQMYDTDNP